MEIGDMAAIKKVRLNKDYDAETIYVTGKVVDIHLPAFTIKYDKPSPEGYEYQEFSLDRIPDVVTIKSKPVNPRDTHLAGFAAALFQEMQADLTALFVALGNRREHNITSAESIIQQLLARRAYDLVVHVLWHTIPADGSSIKQYQGLTIEQIAAMIPDLPELPEVEE